jgi:hypothetical protein
MRLESPPVIEKKKSLRKVRIRLNPKRLNTSQAQVAR